MLTTCAKILGTQGSRMSDLIELEHTKCSHEVWNNCRNMLSKKVAKLPKKKAVQLEWLPTTLEGGLEAAKGEGKGGASGGGAKKEEL